ncbi:porin family protein [Fulvivirga lutea]|uniref:PorT family protein n=1 Tax=Fulvivirga lutea TaxID=2810512 RepID=A0A974WER0_9BACT|nr:outer membrane beta-barrel protein [Fulvivirga lutea]QSE96053.1 PorT family protein [Fulvivirga lutea]
MLVVVNIVKIMNRLIIISVVITLGTLDELMAQKRMLVKYEIGVAHTNYELVNPQNNVRISDNNHAFHGISASYEVKHNFHLETGLYSKYYGADFYSNSPDTTNLIIGINKIQIPLRIIYRNNILSDRLYFTLVVGSSILINHSQSGFIFSSTNEFKTIGDEPKKSFGLVELGLGIDYEIFNNFSLGFYIRSFYGLNQNINIQYDNINSDNTITNYDINSNGDFQAYMLAVGYKFGKRK